MITILQFMRDINTRYKNDQLSKKYNDRICSQNKLDNKFIIDSNFRNRNKIKNDFVIDRNWNIKYDRS